MTETVGGTPISIVAAGGRARALFEGHELADSARALLLIQANQPPVCYFPREDVQMSVLRANGHATTSPRMGPATWFTIMRDAKVIEDVAWSYEHPFDDTSAIAGHIAFDERHVDIELDDPLPVRHVPAHDPPYA
jgi:uncharacterized protein (DUF427 family)